MKKLTLSIGLVAVILSAKAQDTICTYFQGKEVLEFNYKKLIEFNNENLY